MADNLNRYKVYWDDDVRVVEGFNVLDALIRSSCNLVGIRKVDFLGTVDEKEESMLKDLNKSIMLKELNDYKVCFMVFQVLWKNGHVDTERGKSMITALQNTGFGNSLLDLLLASLDDSETEGGNKDGR